MRLSADHKLCNYRPARLHRALKIRAYVTLYQLSLDIKSRVDFLDRVIFITSRFPQITRARNIEFFVSGLSHFFSLNVTLRESMIRDISHMLIVMFTSNVSAHWDLYSQFDKLRCKETRARHSLNYSVEKKLKFSGYSSILFFMVTCH